jgi:hypothetical protein
MKIVQFIRDKMCTREYNRSASDAQDLVFYRQLRRAENKLHEAREGLNGMMELQESAVAEHVCLTQGCDGPEQQLAAAGDNARSVDSMQEPQQGESQRKDLDHQLDELQKNVVFLKNDIPRLEAEYQQAQMNVRTHFYLEICPGSLMDGDVTAGQSA